MVWLVCVWGLDLAARMDSACPTAKVSWEGEGEGLVFWGGGGQGLVLPNKISCMQLYA